MKSINQDKIDKFLLDRQNQEEKKSFTTLMEQDSNIRKEVQLQQAMFDYLGTLGDLRIVKTVSKVHQNAQTIAKRKVRLRIIRWVSAAAAVLLLFTTFWFLLQRPPLNERLYQAHYEPYNILFGARNTETPSQLADAGLLYHQQEYDRAIPLFEAQLLSEPNSSKARLAAGICQLENERYEEALGHFGFLIQEKDAIYQEQAQWYSALAYLYLNKVEECKNILKGVAENNNHYFQKQAIELLNQIP